MNQTLSTFLNSHRCEKGKSNEHTHTRIADKNEHIYGGSYNIPDDELETFMNLYYKEVFEKGQPEYITEKQLNNGAIMVDFDFQYDTKIKTRQHDEAYIIDMITIYNEEIRKIINMPENETYEVYILEKPNVNCLTDKTKDGIHMVICLNMQRDYQMLLRKMVSPRIKDMWDDLPLTNTIDKIIDEGVVKASCNWQMFGSCKPKNETYGIKYAYTVAYDDFKNIELKEENQKDIFFKISARNQSHKSFPINKNIELPLDSGYSTPTSTLTPNEPISGIAIDKFIHHLKNIDVKFLESDSDWLKLGFAIKSIYGEPNWFDILCAVSQRSRRSEHRSNYVDYDQWKVRFEADSKCGVPTLLHYSKISNETTYNEIEKEFDEEKEIKIEGKAKLIEALKVNAERNPLPNIYDTTDYGRAKLYLHLIGDNFQYKDKKPYIYAGRLWKCDSDKEQRALCKSIQDILIPYYTTAIKVLTEKIAIMDPCDPTITKIRENHKYLMDNLLAIKSQSKLVKTKDQILIHTEVSQIRFDLVKPYYFVFKNTAFDFETGNEVQIKKEDYITQCTQYDYIPPPKEDIDEMQNVLKSILPNKNILTSFLSVLRTACTGKRIEKFIMMTGRGRNGKGLINQLMKVMLKEYFYQGNINTITEKIKSGGNPEVANMDKARAVCFSEPEDNQQLMLGAIKALTGEDTTNARRLFENNTETVLLLTMFMEVNGEPNVCGKIGDAIKERFMLYNFPNLFTSDESLIDNITKFRQNLLYKENSWRENIRHALFYILLNLKDETGNIIKDIYAPQEITTATNNYLQSKDELSNWFDEEYVIIDDVTFTKDIKNNHITVKDMYAIFKNSQMYENSSRQDKRKKYSKKGFEDEVKENIKLKPYYIDDKKFGEKGEIRLRNSFIRMRQKTDEEKAEDLGE